MFVQRYDKAPLAEQVRTSPTVKVVPDATERPPLTVYSIPGDEQSVRHIIWNNCNSRNVRGRRFLFNIGGTIDRGAQGAEVERRRRENRDAVSAEGGCGEGVFPSPLGDGSGVPPP